VFKYERNSASPIDVIFQSSCIGVSSNRISAFPGKSVYIGSVNSDSYIPIYVLPWVWSVSNKPSYQVNGYQKVPFHAVHLGRLWNWTPDK